MQPICTLPFTHFLVERDGTVRCCCHNVEVKFGDLNTQTLDEIWHGDIYTKFRDLLSDGLLPDGCGKGGCPCVKRGYK